MEMNILVCIKSVPDVGGKINLTDDSKNIDEKNLGYWGKSLTKSLGRLSLLKRQIKEVSGDADK